MTPCETASSSSLSLGRLTSHQPGTQRLFVNYLFPSDADFLAMDAFIQNESGSSSSEGNAAQLQSDVEKMIGRNLNLTRKLFLAVSSLSEIERNLIDIQFECAVVSNSLLATKQVPSYKESFMIANYFNKIRLEYSVQALEACHEYGTYRLRRNNIEFNGKCDFANQKNALNIQMRHWNSGDWNKQFITASFLEYEVGFGGPHGLWLGLKNIHALTQKSDGAIVSLWNDDEREDYAYVTFTVDVDYHLSVDGGDASLLGSNGKPFLMTKNGRCDPKDSVQGAWWFDCHGKRYNSNLNRHLHSYDSGVSRIGFQIIK